MKEIPPAPRCSKKVPAWGSTKKKILARAMGQKKILVSWKFPTLHLFSTGPSLSYLLSMKVHMAWTTGRNISQALVRDKYSWDDLRTTLSWGLQWSPEKIVDLRNWNNVLSVIQTSYQRSAVCIQCLTPPKIKEPFQSCDCYQSEQKCNGQI